MLLLRSRAEKLFDSVCERLALKRRLYRFGFWMLWILGLLRRDEFYPPLVVSHSLLELFENRPSDIVFTHQSVVLQFAFDFQSEQFFGPADDYRVMQQRASFWEFFCEVCNGLIPRRLHFRELC